MANAKPGTWLITMDGQQVRAQHEPAPEEARVLGQATAVVDRARGVNAWATIGADEEGRPTIRSVHVQIGLDGDVSNGGVTGKDLRSISLNALLTSVTTELEALKGDVRWRLISGMDQRVSDLIAESAKPRRKAGNRVPDATLRRVAELYLKHQAGGRGLRRKMMRDLRMPEQAEPTLVYWIRRAREEGWLTPAEHGAARASAGPLLESYRQSKGKK